MFLVLITPVLSKAQIKIDKWNDSHNTSFAIVVDELTYDKCKTNIDNYRRQIEKEGISCYLIRVNEATPLQIKLELKKMHNSTPMLEGAVFIGNIPVPMIRDAQHLTSAYKKNQSRGTYFDTSVPSDRFYEDFDLKFKFLERDSVHTDCYYYSLKAESEQQISKEIYSGRIKPPFNDDSKYDLINEYLKKVVKYKNNKSEINDMFTFLGHGYNSESLTAWGDDYLMAKEQFPSLFELGNTYKHLHFDMSTKMKAILMRELENPDLDIAVFHAHGSKDSQYLIEYPKPQMARAQVEDIKLFLRSKLRTAKRRNKDIEKTKEYYIKNYGVTDSWFKGAFADSVKKADSLLAYSLDMHSEDLDKFDPNPKFMMFDECFNGAFHIENYIAGRYLFDKGNLISAVANSVNVLQDIWANRYLGLLDLGVSTGRRHLFISYLENHIIGDPTFSFKTSNNLELGEKIILEKDNLKLWKNLLNSKDSRLRALAVEMVFQRKNNESVNTLRTIYETDKSVIVRMQALYSCTKHYPESLDSFLVKSYKDPSAYIRKVSAKIMGKKGKNEFVPLLIERMFNDHCKRVSFNARTALAVMDTTVCAKTFKDFYSKIPVYSQDKEIEKYYNSFFKRNAKWLREGILKRIANDELTLKKRLNACRTLRNYNFVNSLSKVIDIVKDDTYPESIRVYLIEALGWFGYSADKESFVIHLKELENKTTSELIANEARKSINRLITGPNEPFTP